MSSASRPTARGAWRRATDAIEVLRGGPVYSPEPPLPSEPAPAPPSRSRGWWDLLPFTTHRITLAPGIDTMLSGIVALDDVRTDIVIEACGGSLAGRTVVDLGCLEGGFTLAFAHRGAELSVGIEARKISVRRCELARSLLGVTNAEFVLADITEELGRRDRFDVVFASGILYHVSDPAELLCSVRSACRQVALIDTHVARPDVATHDCSDVVTRQLCGRSYRGRMYPEYPVGEDQREDLLWAAWNDADSFWPMEDDLVAMIHDAGFRSIERVDPAADGCGDRWRVDPISRVMYLAWV